MGDGTEDGGRRVIRLVTHHLAMGDNCLVTLRDFQESLALETAPNLPVPLIALWYDARGDWNGAHEEVQSDATPSGAWVHAYLHRKEGDLSNAQYWYQRAGRAPASGVLQEEWEQIAMDLLVRTP